MSTTDINLEETMRAEAVCRGCGKPKDAGCIVCWGCFKYRTDITPFKWFDGTIEEWIATAQKGRDA
ncbi:MAG: hypothetical protein NTW96_24670 [Planctomycetia bacterium]|nr:hypothetical protein [Planctomycetia bacterium]